MTLALALLALSIIMLFSGLIVGALRQQMPRRSDNPFSRVDPRNY